MKLKLKMSIKILTTIKKCLTLVIIQLNQNIMIIQTNKWLVKWKIKKSGVAVEEFVGLKSKMCLYLVDDNSELKKAKGVKRSIVATISHNEYKYVLLHSYKIYIFYNPFCK